MYGPTSAQISNSVTWPDPLPELHLDEKVTLDVHTDVIVSSLGGDGTGLVNVKDGATLTVTGLTIPEKGCQSSITIDEGCTMDVTQVNNFLMRADSPVFLIMGTLQGEEITVAPDGSVTVGSEGALVMSSLKLMSSSSITLAEGSVVGTAGSGFKLDTLSVGPSSIITFYEQSSVEIEAINLEFMLNSRIETTSELKTFTIKGVTMTMYDKSLLQVNGGGNNAGDGACDETKGATYGGQGGASTVSPLGSVESPSDYGTGCSTIRGGGKVTVEVTSLILDGIISANGDNSSTTGGASGGTIVITADSLTGHGDILAQGGAGIGMPGGGGGRISLDIDSIEFIGAVSTHGGLGTFPGAAGTVFSEYIELGNTKQKITVDNEKIITDAVTGITDGLSSVSTTLEVLGDAVVMFTSDTQNLYNLQSLVGDYTGIIYALSGQRLELATTSGIQSHYALPCKVHIEEGSHVEFSPKLMLVDPVMTNRERSNLYVGGTLAGVTHLTVGENGQVELLSTSNTENSITSTAGMVAFTSLNILSSGVLSVGLDSTEPFTLKALDTVGVHYGGKVLSKKLVVEAPAIHISYKGEVSVDGQGHASEEGSGAGSEGNTTCR